VKELAKEIKGETKVIESENEFGGNIRIWKK
jgi:hypothetical protein